jgi:hypothetical protein
VTSLPGRPASTSRIIAVPRLSNLDPAALREITLLGDDHDQPRPPADPLSPLCRKAILNWTTIRGVVLGGVLAAGGRWARLRSVLAAGGRWARLRRLSWQPPHAHGEQPRELVAGPLELFYDLATVVLVAQAADHLVGT